MYRGDGSSRKAAVRSFLCLGLPPGHSPLSSSAQGEGSGEGEGEGEEGEKDHSRLGDSFGQPASPSAEADADGRFLSAQDGRHFDRSHQGEGREDWRRGGGRPLDRLAAKTDATAHPSFSPSQACYQKGGASVVAIRKFIISRYPSLDLERRGYLLKQALKRELERGVIRQVSWRPGLPWKAAGLYSWGQFGKSLRRLG